jgi:hypothetical protein
MEKFEMDIRWFKAGENIGPAYQGQYNHKGYTVKEVVSVLSGNTFTIKEVVFESNQDNQKSGEKMQVPHTCIVIDKNILGVIAKMVNSEGVECDANFQVGKTFKLLGIDSPTNENGKLRGSLHVVCQTVKPVVENETKNKIQALLNASKAIDAKLKGEPMSIKEQSLAILEKQEAAKEPSQSYESLQSAYLDEEYVDETVQIIFSEKETDLIKKAVCKNKQYIKSVKHPMYLYQNEDVLKSIKEKCNMNEEKFTNFLCNVIKEMEKKISLTPEEENELALLLKAKEELELRIKILTSK